MDGDFLKNTTLEAMNIKQIQVPQLHSTYTMSDKYNVKLSSL